MGECHLARRIKVSEPSVWRGWPERRSVRSPSVQITQGDTKMRTYIAYSAILIASMLGSRLMATAQTGEFPLQVPGSVVHRGWELQDRLQEPRSGTPTKSPSRAAGSYERSKSAKPTAIDATTTKSER